MPKRPKSPEIEEDARYFTVYQPYPLNANWILEDDQKQCAMWVAECIGVDHLWAIHEKPKARGMILLEVSRAFNDHSGFLGEHRWAEFLKNPTDEEKPGVTRVFHSFYARGRDAQKDGWKVVAVQSSWFNDWKPGAGEIKYPYPNTHWCSVPVEDKTNKPLCRPLPVEHKPPPPRVQPPVVGSSGWVAKQKARPLSSAWSKNPTMLPPEPPKPKLPAGPPPRSDESSWPEVANLHITSPPRSAATAQSGSGRSGPKGWGKPIPLGSFTSNATSGPNGAKAKQWGELASAALTGAGGKSPLAEEPAREPVNAWAKPLKVPASHRPNPSPLGSAPGSGSNSPWAISTPMDSSSVNGDYAPAPWSTEEAFKRDSEKWAPDAEKNDNGNVLDCANAPVEPAKPTSPPAAPAGGTARRKHRPALNADTIFEALPKYEVPESQTRALPEPAPSAPAKGKGRGKGKGKKRNDGKVDDSRMVVDTHVAVKEEVIDSPKVRWGDEPMDFPKDLRDAPPPGIIKEDVDSPSDLGSAEPSEGEKKHDWKKKKPARAVEEIYSEFKSSGSPQYESQPQNWGNWDAAVPELNNTSAAGKKPDNGASPAGGMNDWNRSPREETTEDAIPDCGAPPSSGMNNWNRLVQEEEPEASSDSDWGEPVSSGVNDWSRLVKKEEPGASASNRGISKPGSMNNWDRPLKEETAETGWGVSNAGGMNDWDRPLDEDMLKDEDPEMEAYGMESWRTFQPEPEDERNPEERWQSLLKRDKKKLAALVCPTHNIACKKGICIDMAKLIREEERKQRPHQERKPMPEHIRNEFRKVPTRPSGSKRGTRVRQRVEPSTIGKMRAFQDSDPDDGEEGSNADQSRKRPSTENRIDGYQVQPDDSDWV